jgi:hypothetical protein
MKKTTLWDRTQVRGKRLREKRQQEAEKRWETPKRQAVIAGEVLEAIRKGASLDGAMIYILGEEWKEVKVGCVFEYETRLARCRKTGEQVEVVKAKAQSYMAYLGEPETFGKLLAAEAERRGFYRARHRVVVADGAKWVWNLSALCFPVGQEIVDWNHAVSHLWTAVHIVHEPDTLAAKRLGNACEDALWKGEVHRVIEEIEALAKGSPDASQSLHTEAGYFRTNARRMRYQEFREDGYPIGSGTVESGCKRLIGMRMRGPGMRWSRPGAENILALRCEYLSNRWDEAWQLTCAV